MEKRIRKPRNSLTARQVDALKKPGKYYDGHGLFLRINASGSKQWLQRLTVQGRRRELGLGSPPVITLAIAREIALENRRCAVLGGDPLAEKRAAKNKARPLSFAECVAAYADVKLTELSSEKHRREWVRSLERLAFPAIGNLPVKDIQANDVLRMLEPHWKERTVTAKKLRGRVEAVLSWLPKSIDCQLLRNLSPQNLTLTTISWTGASLR